MVVCGVDQVEQFLLDWSGAAGTLGEVVDAFEDRAEGGGVVVDMNEGEGSLELGESVGRLVAEFWVGDGPTDPVCEGSCR